MARAIADLASGFEGESCVLFPRFSPFADEPIEGVRTAVIGRDLVTMNSVDEEWAYEENSRLFEGVIDNLAPVILFGADLRTALPALFDMRVRERLIVHKAIERLRQDGIANIVVWAHNFSSFDVSLVEGETQDRILKWSGGTLIPQPALSVTHAFGQVGERLLGRLQTRSIDLKDVIGSESPVRSGLSIGLFTSNASYLAEADAVLAGLRDDGLEYRVIHMDGIASASKPARGGTPSAVLMPEHLEANALAPKTIVAALGALYAQLDALLETPGRRLPEIALRLIGRTRHASAFRRAYRHCVALERLAVWLEHDQSRCLMCYPSETRLDPLPSQLMATRGGCDIRLIQRSITADFRNFYMPPTDVLLVLGEGQVAVARERGFGGVVVPVGAVGTDRAFAHWTRESARREILTNVREDDKVILVATSAFDRAGEARWLPALAAAVRNKSGVVLVVKAHPSQDPVITQRAIDPDGHRVMLDTRRTDIHPLIAAADMVLTDVSHVGKLTVLRGLPLGVVNFSGQPFPYNRYDELGVATAINTAAQLHSLIDTLKAGELAPTEPAARENFVRNEFTADDGRSGTRVANTLRMLLGDPTGRSLVVR